MLSHQFGFDIKDEDISMYQGERLYMWEGGVGGGGTWVNFCWVCANGLSESLPHYSQFSVANIIDLTLVTFGQICNFRDPDLVTFYFCVYHINRLNRSFQNELTNIE